MPSGPIGHQVGFKKVFRSVKSHGKTPRSLLTPKPNSDCRFTEQITTLIISRCKVLRPRGQLRRQCWGNCPPRGDPQAKCQGQQQAEHGENAAMALQQGENHAATSIGSSSLDWAVGRTYTTRRVKPTRDWRPRSAASRARVAAMIPLTSPSH